MAQLKVYRTPAGFHDAYVAAPSQKAALKAWGSDADLFARGVAEVVTDPKLTKAPLAAPGEVIKVARTMADAAPEPSPKTRTARKPADQPSAKPKPAGKPKPAPKPKPKPSRARLHAAEAALAAAEQRFTEERDAFRREEAELVRRRKQTEQAQAKERAKLDEARERAERNYAAALERWRNG